MRRRSGGPRRRQTACARRGGRRTTARRRARAACGRRDRSHSAARAIAPGGRRARRRCRRAPPAAGASSTRGAGPGRRGRRRHSAATAPRARAAAPRRRVARDAQRKLSHRKTAAREPASWPEFGKKAWPLAKWRGIARRSAATTASEHAAPIQHAGSAETTRASSPAASCWKARSMDSAVAEDGITSTASATTTVPRSAGGRGEVVASTGASWRAGLRSQNRTARLRGPSAA